jgi:hypothetical protein
MSLPGAKNERRSAALRSAIDVAAATHLAGVAHGTQFSDNNPADRPDHGIEAAQRERLELLRAQYDPSGLLCGHLGPEESTTALGVHRATVPR